MWFLCFACGSGDGSKPDTIGSAPPGSTTTFGSTRAPGHYFPDNAVWTTDISDAGIDPDSDVLIDRLQQAGWGFGRFQIEPSLDVLIASADTPSVPFEATDDFYDPDCDAVPVPLPAGGHVEGEVGYECTQSGDCHLIVVDEAQNQLFEMWRANVVGDTFFGGCLAVWEMDRVYPESGRGDQCSSADAAGYPIAPLLLTADEVMAGDVGHALRFVLPNFSIRDGEFVHPATHATNSDGGGADTLPYGARLRLRADFDLGRISDPDATAVVVALQTYGMFLADGGNVALTVQSDIGTETKWDEVFEEDGTHALEAIEPADFEVLVLGTPIPLTFDCVRNIF